MLRVQLGRLRLENPILTASGTFGFGKEFQSFVDLRELGGIVTKTLYLHRRRGNPPPRIVEVHGGMLNSIGLENPGCDAFERELLPWLRERGVVVIASCAGERPDDFPRVVERLDSMKGLAALEVNLSCPNVERGGLDIGTDPDAIHRILGRVREATGLPVLAKLTPNVTDIRTLAHASEDAGADGLSLINTLAAMAVDWRKRESRLGTQSGGLSGPCIKPVALRMVWLAARAVKIPIIGIGGIKTAEDVLEFLVTGARAVQVGTSNFFNPAISSNIVEDLRHTLDTEGVGSVESLIGTLQDRSESVPPSSVPADASERPEVREKK